MRGTISATISSEPKVVATMDLGPAKQKVVGVVDDDVLTRRLLHSWLGSDGYTVIDFASGAQVLSATQEFDVICLDVGLGDISGLEVLQHLCARTPGLQVVMVTGSTEIETAVAAMRSGAYDYLVKPIDSQRLRKTVQRAIERRELLATVNDLKSQLEAMHSFERIVGSSTVMHELSRQIARVQRSDVPVCLFGESGTGKELVARAIHDCGSRRDGPFVAINCAAIPSSLQDAELFGYERGAFTGSVRQHKGRFEEAAGGTIFLDELGEMAPSTQALLLRTLQERVIRRVGGTTDIAIDTRVISATHRDLEAEVRAGRFRQDLYFRLAVYPIHLPPLRDRLTDLPLLVRHFLSKFQPTDRPTVTHVSHEFMEALARHSWPGNIRELENVVRRAILNCDGNELGIGNLPPELRKSGLPELPAPVLSAAPSDKVLPLIEVEKLAILRALEATQGHVGRAAKLLAVGRATLYRRIIKLGIAADSESASLAQPAPGLAIKKSS